MNDKTKLWLPILLMLVFALTRWPGLLPDNFSAAYALAFCAGIYFAGSIAWWLPLSVLFLSGALLNIFHYDFPVFSPYSLLSFLAFAVIIGLGRLFRKGLGKVRSRGGGWLETVFLIGGGMLGAILFYVVTNTISWIFEPTQPYPKTLAGWLKALTVGTAGWPQTWTFFKSTLTSSGLFTALFVGAMKLAEKLEPEEADEEEEEDQEDTPEESSPQPQES